MVLELNALDHLIVTADVGIDDPVALRTAWESNETFVVVPAKCGVAPNILHESLAALPDDLRTGHFVILSSGSTGEPKLIIGSRDRAAALVAVLHQLQESEPVEETIVMLPLAYSYAFVNQWVWSQTYRRRLARTAGLRDPQQLGETLSSAVNAMLCLVGPQLPLLTSHFPTNSFPGVIRVHFAGGRFPQEHLHEVRKLFPNAAIYNNYGCVEAMPRLTLRRAEASDDAADVGLPLPGIQIRTDTDEALLFRSPYRAVAVVEHGCVTRYDDDLWLPSGDLAQQRPDGSWRLIGRRAEVYKRHGERIQLANLTAAIATVWNGQIAVRRETDPVGEEGHVLILAPHPPAGLLPEVLALLRSRFRRPYWPLRIESLDRMPELPNGKVDMPAIAISADRRLLWTQRL